MKIELVDVCGQTDTINKEVEQLKQKGFFITGQHGGGEYGSCLILKRGETEDEIKQVKQEAEKHEEYVKSYWDWHNKVYK